MQKYNILCTLTLIAFEYVASCKNWCTTTFIFFSKKWLCWLMIKMCLCLISCFCGVYRWRLPHGHARTNVGGTRPHSDRGTDVKNPSHSHAYTHILALLTPHPHTLSTNPVRLLQSSRDPPCVSRSGNGTTTGRHTTVFVTKILTKITVSKEQAWWTWEKPPPI